MLAAALDQPVGDVTAAEVHVEAHNPSGVLLAGWLRQRLGVETTIVHSSEPGISTVVLTTTDGEVRLARPDGRVGELTVPGMPPAVVALPRRSLAELLSEELRRLDPDEVYLEALQGVAAVTAHA
jgi:glucose-6-phosphate dehydrogenase assembly protein OpcA